MYFNFVSAVHRLFEFLEKEECSCACELRNLNIYRSLGSSYEKGEFYSGLAFACLFYFVKCLIFFLTCIMVLHFQRFYCQTLLPSGKIYKLLHSSLIYTLCFFYWTCYYLVTVYSGQGFKILKPIAIGKFLLHEMSLPLLPHNKRILSFWGFLASLWNMDRLASEVFCFVLFPFNMEEEE